MYDILTGIYYGELTNLRGKGPLEPPCSIAGERLQRLLLAVEPETAKAFRREIRVTAAEQSEAAFQSGVRFGAQLMLQLMETF